MALDCARLTYLWERGADLVFLGDPFGGLRDGGLLGTARVWFTFSHPVPDVLLPMLEDDPHETIVATADREIARWTRHLGAVPIDIETLKLAMDRIGPVREMNEFLQLPLVKTPSAILAMDLARARHESGRYDLQASLRAASSAPISGDDVRAAPSNVPPDSRRRET